jgi:cell division protein FtsB
MTPFARFLLFLIILLPAAYFGAAYYRGEDPVEKLKSTFGQEATAASSSETTTDTYDPRKRVQELEKENAALRQEVKKLKAALEKAGGDTTNREGWGN